VCTLAHYFEEEGIPTAAITLVREQTIKMNPPRALWVPFELGRPLGAPGNPQFQKRVIRAVLALFEAESGPVLGDFPEDAPGTAEQSPTTLVCPVSFPKAIVQLNDNELLFATFQQEVSELRTWYETGVAKRGRTLVGPSGLDPETAAKYVGDFIFTDTPKPPRNDVAPLSLLRLAIEDVKSYYFEAITTQPGQQTANSKTLATWFWRETAAAKILFLLQQRWKEASNPALKDFSRLLLIPRAYQDYSPYR
jgi:hypothetical protein